MRTIELSKLAVLSAVLWVGTTVAAEEVGDRLQVMKAQFEELRADVYSAREKFEARYVKELKKLEESAQAAANLSLMLKVREETEHFRRRKSGAEVSEHPELARVQRVYAEHRVRILAEETSKLASLENGYRKKLMELRDESTRAGNIEEALKMNGELQRLDASVVGRFVRIDLPAKHTDRSHNVLSLAEVQIFYGDENIAVGGKATQSSTREAGGSAQFAIDGNTDGVLEHGSTTHTTPSNAAAWWEVDLGGERGFDKIVIWNRTSSIYWRLDGFTLWVLDEKRETVWKKTFPKAPKTELAVNLGEKPGR